MMLEIELLIFLCRSWHHWQIPRSSRSCLAVPLTSHLLGFLCQIAAVQEIYNQPFLMLNIGALTFMISLTKALSVLTAAFLRTPTPDPIHVIRANLALRLISSPVSNRTYPQTRASSNTCRHTMMAILISVDLCCKYLSVAPQSLRSCCHCLQTLSFFPHTQLSSCNSNQNCMYDAATVF